MIVERFSGDIYLYSLRIQAAVPQTKIHTTIQHPWLQAIEKASSYRRGLRSDIPALPHT